MTRHMIVLFSLTIAAALAARAQTTPAAAAVACPETIAVTESAAPPNGWEASAPRWSTSSTGFPYSMASRAARNTIWRRTTKRPPAGRWSKPGC